MEIDPGHDTYKKPEVIERGIKLMQPWANEIVKGNLPILIRTFNTIIRGRIYIVASTTMDKNDLNNITDYRLLKYFLKTQGYAIGSVDLVDVIKVRKDELEESMKKIMKKKYGKYPKHFIPEPKKSNFLFIWIFNNGIKYDKPICLSKEKGMIWILKTLKYP